MPGPGSAGDGPPARNFGESARRRDANRAGGRFTGGSPPEPSPMPLDRRRFLAAAGGLLAAPALAARRAVYDPDTLFLSYAGDPTTSVRVQWIGEPGQTTAPP